MENDGTTNNRGETPADPYPVAAKKQTRKERSKANATSQKTNQDKEKSYRRSWRQTSPVRKIEIIIGAIVAAGAIGYLGVTIWGTLQTKWNFEAEHRPRVAISRAPELGGVISCQVTKKEIWIHTGPMHFWVKNTSGGNAVGAFATMADAKPVLENRIGDPELDDPPVIEERSCMSDIKPKMAQFPVHRGEEVRVDMVQSANTIGLVKSSELQMSFNGPRDDSKPWPDESPLPLRASITNNTSFQFYAPVCVYYFDESGKRYGSCRTYRFHPTSNDRYAFSCSQTPLTGTFDATMFGYCEN